MDILQMSFSAAIFIITIAIFRELTLYKLPKNIFLVLWGVVICRLLIPFSIPSRLSFYTGMEILRRASTETTHFTAPAMSVVDIGKLANSGTSTISMPISTLALIWLTGMCVCAIFFIVTYIKCRREFNTALPVENDFIVLWQQKHPLRLPVHIRQSDRIKGPLTYGVFQPVLLLPKETDWTDETSLQYILTHEYVHIKRFDALTKLLLTFALCVHWFNPFVWVMYMLANRDLELSCDETVVRTFGEPMKSAYALTLIGLEEKKSRLTPLFNGFSKNAIEERITAIMKIKKYSVPVIIIAVLLIAGVTVGLVTSPATKVSNNSYAQHDTEALTAEPTSGNTDDSSSPSRNEPAENSFQDQSKTHEDNVIISKRFYPITGEYLLTRINLETGNTQVSFDDGATWLFRSIDPETGETEVSPDGKTWYNRETWQTISGV